MRIICALGLLLIVSPGRGCITEPELKARIEEATKGLKDLSMVTTVTEKNRAAVEKIGAAYLQLYEFKSATVMFKPPGRLRMEGKLGMVKFEYIINNNLQIVRAPRIRLSKKTDFSDDPAKVQRALDIGLVTPCLWQDRRIEVMDDPEARANGEIKIRLYWPKGDMIYLAWIDEKDLWLKKFEKRDGANNLSLRVVYSNPRNPGGVIWVPTRVEVYSGDGDRAGASEITDIRVNSGLQDSLFE